MKSNLLSEAVSIETDSNKPNLPLKKIGKRPAPIWFSFELIELLNGISLKSDEISTQLDRNERVESIWNHSSAFIGSRFNVANFKRWIESSQVISGEKTLWLRPKRSFKQSIVWNRPELATVQYWFSNYLQ